MSATPRIRVIQIPDINPRDKSALCATCGRMGTWALILPDDSAAPARYCRRCWPDAHRRSNAAVERAIAEHWTRQRAWMMKGISEPPPETPPELRGRVVKWHWSLIPGTWLRSLRSDRAMLAAVRQSAT